MKNKEKKNGTKKEFSSLLIQNLINCLSVDLNNKKDRGKIIIECKYAYVRKEKQSFSRKYFSDRFKMRSIQISIITLIILI